MSETKELHLLDERGITMFSDQSGRELWWSDWFPFSATVHRSLNGQYSWSLKLMGGYVAFRRGEEETREAAFQAVADAKKNALKKLVEQLAEVQP